MKPFPAADQATCPVFAAALHRAKARLGGSRLNEAATRLAEKSAKLSRVLTTARPKKIRKEDRA